MATIHHTQHKQAAKFGFTLATNENGFVATSTTDPTVTFENSDLKALLNSLDLSRTAGGAGDASKPRKSAKKPTSAKKPVRKVADEDEDEGADEGADESEAEDEAEEEEASGSVVKPKYKQQYKDHNDTCGDAFADAFAAACGGAGAPIDFDAMKRVGKQNGVDVMGRWGHMIEQRGGYGRIRMNLGNVMRGMNRRGADVTIGSQTFKGEPQTEKPTKPAGKTAKAKKTAKKGARK